MKWVDMYVSVYSIHSMQDLYLTMKDDMHISTVNTSLIICWYVDVLVLLTPYYRTVHQSAGLWEEAVLVSCYLRRLTGLNLIPKREI